MRTRSIALAAATFVALAACNSPAPAPPRVQPESPASQAPAGQAAAATPEHRSGDHHGEGNAARAAQPGIFGTRRFGEALGREVAPARLSEMLQAPDRYRTQPVRIEGTVAAVCQAMGCWMELRDQNTQAHIRMHGHSFFVPRDVNGKRAFVQGTLVAAHPPTECDQEAREATGQVAQIELDATGIEVVD